NSVEVVPVCYDPGILEVSNQAPRVVGEGSGRLYGVGCSCASPHDAQCIVWGATSVIILVYIDFFFVGHVSFVGENVLVYGPELSVEGIARGLGFRKAVCRSLMLAWVSGHPLHFVSFPGISRFRIHGDLALLNAGSVNGFG
ncbi:3015_t:CDS:2, partial [Gigaspora rosea]